VSDEAPVFPPGRYGRRREPGRARRIVPVVVLVLIVLGCLWLAERLYAQYGNLYQAQVTSVEQVTDTSVTVVFTVQKPDSRPATCRLQAKDASGVEVGYAEVPVTTGGTHRKTMSTTGRTTKVEVLGCRAG
jgi:hypothetical protein